MKINTSWMHISHTRMRVSTSINSATFAINYYLHYYKFLHHEFCLFEIKTSTTRVLGCVIIQLALQFSFLIDLINHRTWEKYCGEDTC